jgi:hypothetical protein
MEIFARVYERKNIFAPINDVIYNAGGKPSSSIDNVYDIGGVHYVLTNVEALTTDKLNSRYNTNESELVVSIKKSFVKLVGYFGGSDIYTVAYHMINLKTTEKIIFYPVLTEMKLVEEGKEFLDNLIKQKEESLKNGFYNIHIGRYSTLCEIIETKETYYDECLSLVNSTGRRVRTYIKLHCPDGKIESIFRDNLVCDRNGGLCLTDKVELYETTNTKPFSERSTCITDKTPITWERDEIILTIGSGLIGYGRL